MPEQTCCLLIYESTQKEIERHDKALMVKLQYRKKTDLNLFLERR